MYICIERERDIDPHYGQFSNYESLNLEFASDELLNEGGGFS